MDWFQQKSDVLRKLEDDLRTCCHGLQLLQDYCDDYLMGQRAARTEQGDWLESPEATAFLLWQQDVIHALQHTQAALDGITALSSTLTPAPSNPATPAPRALVLPFPVRPPEST